MLPAHKTKHISTLSLPLASHTFLLHQSDDGTTNGTALWLGAQCLSLYLHDWAVRSKLPRPPRVIELGAGVGLTSLVLAAQGCHVLATDINHVVRSVLAPTIRSNAGSLTGSIRVRELDWTVHPDLWSWSNPESIAAVAPNSITGTSTSPSSTRESQACTFSFDLIVTSDTVYIPELVQPLLRTLHHLCAFSLTRPVVYLCVERRDPALLAATLASAKTDWGFTVTPLSHRKLSNAMKRTGWPKEEWAGIEIFKLVLPRLDKKELDF